MRKEIGGLLRFAPGRLGARKARAPCCCGARCCAASRLPCVDLGDELRPEAPGGAGPRLLSGAGMATGSAKRAMRQPWLAKKWAGAMRPENGGQV